MSHNDDALARAEYDRMVARGVNPEQHAQARLMIGVNLAESNEFRSHWALVTRFYYDDAAANGYLPANASRAAISLDELRAAETEFYGDNFPDTEPGHHDNGTD